MPLAEALGQGEPGLMTQSAGSELTMLATLLCDSAVLTVTAALQLMVPLVLAFVGLVWYAVVILVHGPATLKGSSAGSKAGSATAVLTFTSLVSFRCTVSVGVLSSRRYFAACRCQLSVPVQKTRLSQTLCRWLCCCGAMLLQS